MHTIVSSLCWVTSNALLRERVHGPDSPIHPALIFDSIVVKIGRGEYLHAAPTPLVL